MQALVMQIILLRQVLSTIIDFRCLYVMWSGPGDEAEEHLAIAFLNS